MKLKLLLAAAAVAFTALPAQAQDGVGGDFTGPRIEAHVAWDRTGINLRDTRNFGGRGDFGVQQQDNELSYGGEVGFDAELGGFVVGAYAGIDFSDAEEDVANGTILLSAERNMYAGVRGGIVAGDNILVYARGGFSRGRLDATFPTTGTSAINPATYDENFDGWHVGGGAEVAVGPMFYLRADYTHTRYEDRTVSPTQELRFTRNQITGAIGLRF